MPKLIDLTGQRFDKLLVLEKAPSQKRHVYWKCQCDCGNTCDVESYNLRANLTKSCGCITSSIGELNIEQILLNNNINYKKEYTFDDLKGEKGRSLRFDFGVLQNNILVRLIEFDGEQHYNDYRGLWNNINDPLIKRQKRDQEKNEYAKSHNIPLVRIPYWERDHIILDMLMGDKYLI